MSRRLLGCCRAAASARSPLAKNSSAADFRQPAKAPEVADRKSSVTLEFSAATRYHLHRPPRRTPSIVRCARAIDACQRITSISFGDPQPPVSQRCSTSHFRHSNRAATARRSADICGCWAWLPLLGDSRRTALSICRSLEYGVGSRAASCRRKSGATGPSAADDPRQRFFPRTAPLLTEPASPQPKHSTSRAAPTSASRSRTSRWCRWMAAGKLGDCPARNCIRSPDLCPMPRRVPRCFRMNTDRADARYRTCRRDEQSKNPCATPPPFTVQFRRHGLAGQFPRTLHDDRSNGGVASEFDVEDVPQPDADRRRLNQIRAQLHPLQARRLMHPRTIKLLIHPTRRSDHDGPAVSLPPAQVTAPLDSLEPVDAVPEESSDQSTSDRTEKQSTEPAPPVVEPPPLTRQLVNLRSRVRSVLKGYYRKTLNSREHDPWEVMHGMLAYGVHSRIRQGGPRGELITTRRLAVLQQAVQGPDADVRHAARASCGRSTASGCRGIWVSCWRCWPSATCRPIIRFASASTSSRSAT